MPVRSQRKNSILLDWVNIRYQTIYRMVGFVVVLGVAVGAVWAWWSHRDPARIEAQKAVEEASERVVEAGLLDLSDEPFLLPLLDAARASLSRGRGALEASDYEDATVHASGGPGGGPLLPAGRGGQGQARQTLRLG